MPFLNAETIRKAKERREFEKQQKAVNFVLNKIKRANKQKQAANDSKGKLYEQYIGSRYVNKGYDVVYNGINNGKRDGGIDLICRKNGIPTVLVQCKCYDNSYVTVKEIHQFYGACQQYKKQHPDETFAKPSFWTSATNPQQYVSAQKAANILNMNFRHNVKLPADFKP